MSIEKVAVIGCGQMGLGITEVCAVAGFEVVAIKATGGDLEKVRARLAKSLDRRVAKGKLSAEDRDATLARVRFAGDLEPVADVDLVIESALEDFAIKADLLQAIEAKISEGTILASNTSSLPLVKLAERVKRPEQLLALHFFNPAVIMKLVELGVTDKTAPGVTEAARAFCQQIGKVPVEVSASPGYVVNRLLVPYLLHAIETLESGIAGPEAIDEAMRLGCVHPMGPLSLADLIGLDVVAAMAATLQAELRDSRYRVPSLLRRLVNAGELGRKAGKGIFDYTGEQPVPSRSLQLPSPLANAAE